MTIWGSRKILSDKGLRCKIHIARIGNECRRPARVYGQWIKGWDGEKLDAGLITCCKGHAAMLEKQGVELVVIDRRKRMA